MLADYFDFVGGTSTGAILAASIAKGMTMSALRDFYEDSGPAMLDKASLLRRFRYKYEDEALSEKLKYLRLRHQSRLRFAEDRAPHGDAECHDDRAEGGGEDRPAPALRELPRGS